MDEYDQQYGYATPEEKAVAKARVDEEDPIPFTADHHVPVGKLLAASGTADVVDAFVALLAARSGARVISGEPDDIGRLLSCLGVRCPVLPV